MNLRKFAKTLNQWGQNNVPFLFILDFELEKPMAFTLDKISPLEILFNCNGFTNTETRLTKRQKIELHIKPISFSEYDSKFNKVYQHLCYGNSFLTNLTIKTEIEINQSLHDLYFMSSAKYKLWFRDEFLVFSPETFIRIKDGKIYSYPMKGTIVASLPHAQEIILSDPKEKAEHATIVDLIRNDLSQVAIEVNVTRFRYIEEIKTNKKNLLQVSTEIVGTLPEDYQSKIGDILLTLLPAGSVSGAPKPKTLEIIRNVENKSRGYYTGIFGIFDGQHLDSCVMIRYIEKEGEQYYYRSGGGITAQSKSEKEYEEAIDKIYVPTD